MWMYVFNYRLSGQTFTADIPMKEENLEGARLKFKALTEEFSIEGSRCDGFLANRIGIIQVAQMSPCGKRNERHKLPIGFSCPVLIPDTAISWFLSGMNPSLPKVFRPNGLQQCAFKSHPYLSRKGCSPMAQSKRASHKFVRHDARRMIEEAIALSLPTVDETIAMENQEAEVRRYLNSGWQTNWDWLEGEERKAFLASEDYEDWDFHPETHKFAPK